MFVGCESCPLNGKTRVLAEIVGEPEVAIVGLYPAAEEEKEGRPFVGASGRLVRKVLSEVPLRGYIITNMIQCKPSGEKEAQVAAKYCLQNLLTDIAGVKKVILLGTPLLPTLIDELQRRGKVVRRLKHPAASFREGDLSVKEFVKEFREVLADRVEVTFEPPLYSIPTDIETVRRDVIASGIFSVDIEVDGGGKPPVDPLAQPLVAAIATPTKVYVLPLSPALGDPSTSISILKYLMESSFEKVAHNWVFEWVWLRRLTGFAPRPRLTDSLLLTYIHREDRPSYSLKVICREEFGVPDWSAPVAPYLKAGRMKEIPRSVLFSYCAQDAYWTLRLADRMKSKIERNRLQKLHNSLLIPCAEMYAIATDRGILVDKEWLSMATDALMRKREELERWFSRNIAPNFNPLSPQQVGDLLYRRLNLPVIEYTEKGSPSTREAVLKELCERTGNETLQKILEYRRVTKFLSTYLEGFERWMCSDGYVRPSWRLHGTVTGRVTCSDPPLQTLPAGGEYSELISSVFVPAEGRLFVEVDFKTHEVRVVIALSEDPTGCELIQSGLDLHTEVASRLFNKDPSEVTSEERRIAKSITFGLLYGMSPHSLASAFGLTKGEAHLFVERFYALFPRVREWQRHQIQFCKSVGFVETPTGRRRHLPHILSPDSTKRGSAERQAINMPVQSYASDLCLLTALYFYRESEVKKDDRNPDPLILLTIHDSLLIETSDVEGVKDALQRAVAEVEARERLPVPLGYDIKVYSERWRYESSLTQEVIGSEEDGQ